MSMAFDSFHFGTTPLGLSIPGFKLGKKGPKVFILAGVHGNETEGVVCAFGLLNSLLIQSPPKVQLILVPHFNLEGVLSNSRLNSRGVDLNRNLPTKDWNPQAFDAKYPPGPSPCSEPENVALVNFLGDYKPQIIFSLHSWKPLLNVNGKCLEEAQVLSKLTGYEIVEEIGYPTPGCLGTYAGLEKDMPTITYEIERGQKPQAIVEIHVPAILKTLEFIERTR